MSTSRLQQSKAEREIHLTQVRMEKVSYYYEREMARSVGGLKITLIIDKMDSAKNVVPCFATRMPKDLSEKVKVRKPIPT